MRYWGTEESVTGPRKSKRRAARPRSTRGRRAKNAIAARSSVASGGSVAPFLRRLYPHQAVVSGPVQRVFLFLFAAGLIYAFVLGDGGIIRIAMLRHERAQLDRQIEELQRNSARLGVEIARLRDDAFFIEKAGRERYGYLRPDEYVYKIVSETE